MVSRVKKYLLDLIVRNYEGKLLYIETVKHIAETTVGKFATVGVTIMFYGLGVLYLGLFMGLPLWQANLVQAILSVEGNFWLNHKYTWPEEVSGFWSRIRHVFVRWILFHISKFFITIPLNQWLILKMVEGWSWPIWFSFFANVGILMVVNFVLNDLFVYEKRVWKWLGFVQKEQKGETDDSTTIQT